MKRRRITGIIAGTAGIAGIAGIAADRFCVRKVLEQKRAELEKSKGNLMVLSEWMAFYRRGMTMEKVLAGKGYSAVAIYGMGVLGSQLYQELEGSVIRVRYIMDRTAIRGVYQSEVCGIETELKETDAVIVTPVYQFEEIKEEIQKRNHVPVLALRELLGGGSVEDGAKEGTF